MLFSNICYPIQELHDLLEHHRYYTNYFKYFNFALSIVTCILGVVGNTTVICYIGLILKKRKSKIWFLNLAVCDLISVVLLPLHAVTVLKGTWPFGLQMCKLFLFSVFSNMYACILILIALNITRVLSVTQPMFHLKFLSQKVSCWICTLIWTIAIFSNLPVVFFSNEVNVGEEIHCSLMGFTNVESERGSNLSEAGIIRDGVPNELHHFSYFFARCSEGQCCGGKDTDIIWNNLKYSAEWFSLPFLLIGYFVPICVIIFSNIMIVVKVRKSQTTNTHRLYQIVIAIIVAYFITWTPLMTAEIIILNATRNRNLKVMCKVIPFVPILINISYTNCCLNPILYVLVSSRIRRGLTDFLSSIRSKLSY